MKTFLNRHAFLFIILMSILLASCSDDNDNEIEIEIETPFEAITLNLSGLDLQQADTMFVVNGFTFINESAESTFDNEAITIWFDGNDFHFIELSLDDVQGISMITANVFNNGITGMVTLYNNGSIIEEMESSPGTSDVVFDVENIIVDRLRIASPEGTAMSIKLE